MKFILLIALLISSVFVAEAPAPQKVSLYAAVPTEQRERLKLRLAEFIEYHRTKQWDKVYDFIAEVDKYTVEGEPPRDTFLKQKLYSLINKFTPQLVVRSDDYSSWIIWGCGSFDQEGEMESGLEASLQDGDWYFSPIWSVPSGIGRKPRSCKH